MKPMTTAPRNKVIEVSVGGQWFPVMFLDCAWLREGKTADPECTDCWRVEDGDGDENSTIDFELDEPQGWRDIQSH